MAMNIRKRQVQELGNDEEYSWRSSSSSFVNALRSLDVVYAKTETEHTVQTNAGGGLSLVVFVCMFILFISELTSYLSPPVITSLAVDSRPAVVNNNNNNNNNIFNTHSKLPIKFNITFHALRCSLVSVDIMDVSGEQQALSQQLMRVNRYRIDKEQRFIRRAVDYELTAQEGIIITNLDDHHNLVQEDPNEGCRVDGEIYVNKVAGNMHIALGASHARNVKHVHQFMVHQMTNFNASHTIHQLSFGESYPGLERPLDNYQAIIHEGSGHFQYFVKIVPTIYRSDSLSISTHQYSVTNHSQSLGGSGAHSHQMDGRKIPGFFLVYDVSPFVVTLTQVRKPFLRFVTSLCAIVGGAFTIAGLIDSIVFHSQRVLKR